ncbi:MAG: LysR family transcriptional regulator [Gammaproteobacteria bacterium]|jgi:LysR family glycine cleavage system transcriptional activator|nr:MAG: LysR family transcriptional regulator [Gammaproteobacteria bacterium]
MLRNLPPLIQLRDFETAARHFSFKLAAHGIHVSPSAISHQVKMLEGTAIHK